MQWQYQALVNATTEMLWLVPDLQEFNIPVTNTLVVWSDNIVQPLLELIWFITYEQST